MDPKSVLHDAIVQLNQFNVENAALHKTVNLMRAYFNPDKKPQKIREVKKAIDVLKSHYRLIEKWREGTPQEQKLAVSAFAAIEQYNSIIEAIQQKPHSLKARVHCFLLKKSGKQLPKDLSKIQFPKSFALQIRYTGGEERKKIRCSTLDPNSTSRKVLFLSSVMVPLVPFKQWPHLSRQTLELFQMKAISLIEQHGVLSNSEARISIRKMHLQSHLEGNICHVTGTLSPFPGHTLTISGIFEKSIPKNESFHLTMTATHTGFPYPLQYTGWALPDLVPPFPHNLEELPLLKPIYARKMAAALHLHPNQEWVERAKQLLALKKEITLEHKERFLTLQQELVLSVASAAFPEGVSKETQEAILSFFSKLKQVHHFLDYYAETTKIINESFILRPFTHLESTWLEKRKDNPPLAILDEELEKVEQEFTQQRMQAESELEKATLDFILAQGTLLAAPCYRILLQHFSESRFAPPMLDDFEQKLQVALFRQLELFLNELETGEPSDLFAAIKADIALFHAKSFEAIERDHPAAELVNELEGYFNSCYYAMLN